MDSLITDKANQAQRRRTSRDGHLVLQRQLQELNYPYVRGQALEDLAASGLTGRTVVDNGLKSIPADALGTEEPLPHGHAGPSLEGLAIPYIDLDADGTSAAAERSLVRVTWYGEAPEGAACMGNREQPHQQLGHEACDVYVPTALREALASRRLTPRLVITDCEKKSLAATQEGVPAVAFPGVAAWASPTRRPNDTGRDGDAQLSGETPVPPLLLTLVARLGVQRVLVVADSDMRSNAAMRTAMTKLASALSSQASEVRAMTYAVPAVPDEHGNKAKTGLDEWLVRVGRVRVLHQLDEAFASIPQRIAAQGGFAPLGYRNLTSVVWSHARQCVLELAPNELTENSLCVALGASWVREHYSYVTDTGARKLDVATLRQELLDACQLQGHYDEQSVRGAGVWQVDDGLVVNAGDAVWHSSGAPVGRFADGLVYPAGHRIDLRTDTTTASPDEVRGLYETLGCWSFQAPADRWLLLGWLVVATLVGTLERRPSVILTGARGTGKTALQDLVGNLLGGSALSADGNSTAAGIRQRLGRNALAVLLDEFEPGVATERGQHRVQSIIDMLRSAYSIRESSAGVLRGTSEGQSLSYSVRTAALLSMIVPPRLEAADESRCAVLRLGPLSSGAPAPVLANDEQQARALGQRIRRLVIELYPSFAASLATIREVMLSQGESARFIDTVGTLLAGGWVLLNGSALTVEEANRLLAEQNVDNHRQRLVESTDERECVQWMLGQLVRGQGDDAVRERTVGELLSMAVTGHRDAVQVLERYGLKLTPGGADLQVAASPTYEGVRKLFRESKFANGGHASVLRRITNARDCTPRLAGQSVRAVAIPLAYIDDELAATAHAAQPRGQQATLQLVGAGRGAGPAKRG